MIYYTKGDKMKSSDQIKKIVVRFIEGEKQLYKKLEELYNTCKDELDKDNIYEAYLIEHFKDDNMALLFSLKKQIQSANKPDKKLKAEFKKRRAE
jgi:hypothetical protein